MFYVQRVGIVPRTIRKAAHSGNAPYTNARRHSGVVLAGIHSHRVIPAWSWPESRKKKMDPRQAHSGMTKEVVIPAWSWPESRNEKNGSSGILQSSSWAMTMWFLWLV